MEAAQLTNSAFWSESAPCAAGEFTGKIPACPPLPGHVLFETSGSSGIPKWLALSKMALLASAAAVNRQLDVTSASCWGLALPTHHVGGFGVMARAFAAGCDWCAIAGRWVPAAFVDWLEKNQVTHTSLVPTQVHDLVAAGRRAPVSLCAIVVGGGHLDAATGQAARALGWPVLASYGMTEAASQIATQGLDALETIYQPAPLPVLPIWQTATSPDNLLSIAGPALFSGMLVREHDQWVFVPRAGLWHQTQDRVMLANGCLTVIGRADILVKVQGELVDPEMIERELVALAEGALPPDCLRVVAVPEVRAGQALVPVFEATVDAALIAAVVADYARRAPGFRRLRPPVVLQCFPRSPIGKPRREEITAAIRAMQAPLARDAGL